MQTRAPTSSGSLPDVVARHPIGATALGAVGVSTSGLFVALSSTSPATASVFRCLFAIPMLLPLAVSERRRSRAVTGRQSLWAVLAGVLFAADAIWWTQAIYQLGVGLSAVVVNTQVVMVPLLARFIDKQSLSGRFLLLVPVVVAGTVLASGVVESGVAGSSPVAGTVHGLLAAVCYSLFLFVLRRGGPAQTPVQSYLVIMMSATVTASAAGLAAQSLTMAPGWVASGWLLLTALGGQVLGWLLIAVGSPSLRVEISSALLLITPVAALVLGVLVLDQNPTAVQLVGCVMILLSAYAVAWNGPSGHGKFRGPAPFHPRTSSRLE